MVRQSYTAVVERDRTVEEHLNTEPYECGWASEAIFFVRKLEVQGPLENATLRVEISPDGMRWCDEGTRLHLSDAEVDFCKVRHFGNWLRLAGDLPAGLTLRIIVTLVLKE
jgi:hypothetical protein